MAGAGRTDRRDGGRNKGTKKETEISYVLTRRPDISLHRRPGLETTSVSCVSSVTRRAERGRTGGERTAKSERNKDGGACLERLQLGVTWCRSVKRL